MGANVTGGYFKMANHVRVDLHQPISSGRT